jgi:crossover junction endonuclease MUS81
MSLKGILIKTTEELYTSAARHNMKSRFVYKKILQALNTHTDSIDSLEDIEKIKNIGKKTMERFREVLEKEKGGGDVMANLPAAMDKLTVNIENTSPANAVFEGSSRAKYIPGFRTGGYAILKVLNREDGLSKHQICLRGNKYSNTEFDLDARNSAWSSIKTIIKKGLVMREGKPSKYYLTETGKGMCGELFKEESIVEVDGEIQRFLVVDSREVKSKKDRGFFQREFEKREIEVDIRNLEVGDFLWIRRDGYVERLYNYIVERKRGSDFCSSIADGRFQEQKKRLKECGIDNILYIVEGLKGIHLQKLGANFVLSSLTQTKLEGFIVIETEDMSETVEIVAFLDNLIKEEENQTSLSSTSGDFEEEKPLNIHHNSNENGILKLSYESFADKGTKNKNVKVKDIFYRSLLSIRGVSHKVAEAISEKYSSFGRFYGLSKDVNFLEDLALTDVKGKKLGTKLAQKLYSYLFEG